ncbi:DUF6356 family protein [Planctobacterium marinum]
MLKKLFIEHPDSVNESYGEHFLVAMGFAIKLFIASIVCLVHGLIPGLFVKTASNLMRELYSSMVVNRARNNSLRDKKEQDVIEYMI